MTGPCQVLSAVADEPAREVVVDKGRAPNYLPNDERTQ